MLPDIGSGSAEALKSLLVRFRVSVAASQLSFTVVLMMKRGTETVIGISMSLHVDAGVAGRGDAVAATERMRARKRVRMVAIDPPNYLPHVLGR